MMSTRRSFLAYGVFFAVMALVAPERAFAQAAPSDVTVTPKDFQSVEVSWTHDGVAVTSWEILYEQQDGAGTTLTSGVTKVASVSSRTARKGTVSGLTGEKRYLFTVRGVGVDGAKGSPATVVEYVPVVATYPIPSPSTPRNPMAMGGDETFTLSWDAPFAGHSTLMIEKYEVQKREVAGTLTGDWIPSTPKEVDGDETMITFKDLKNGVSYEGRVRAMNDGGKWSGWTTRDGDDPDDDATAMVGDDDMDDDDDMEETPALPLVGILALFAGLLGAARARLRR